eukprot:g16442.t1
MVRTTLFAGGAENLGGAFLAVEFHMDNLSARAAEAEKRLAQLTAQFQELQSGLAKEVASLRKENAALKAGGGSGATTPSTSAAATLLPSSSSSSSSIVALPTFWDVPKEAGLRHRVALHVLLANEEQWVGKPCCVAGWIRNVREGGAGRFRFVELYDGTTPAVLQVVVNDDVKGFADVKQTSSSIFVIGELIKSQGRGQSVELKANSVQLLGPCDPETYPLSGKGLKMEYLRTHAHLRVRTMAMAAGMRIRNCLAYATHQFYQRRGFQYVHTPLITASDCEGGGEMFRVTTAIENEKIAHLTKEGLLDSTKDFFGKPAYLTVSGQLNVETYCLGLSNVYTFGPTFRAENSHTSRHLAEFWMIEPEIAFADIHENMDCAEAFLKFVIALVMEMCPGDMELLEKFEVKRAGELAEVRKKEEQAEKQRMAEVVKKLRAEGKAVPKMPKKKASHSAWKKEPLRQRLAKVVNSEFARVTYTESIEILKEAVEKKKTTFDEPVSWGMDMASEHERYLCEEHFQKPTIVRGYPMAIKAFYMRQNEDGKTVAAMDMLVPGIGELMGGSQREERLDVLLQRMKDLELDPKDYWWYLDLRRFGGVPHSGFGVGFERLVQYITGFDNIRDVIPFPRYPNNAEF